MTLRFIRALIALVRPYWVSGERWSARGLLAIIVAMNLALVYVNVLFSSWNNRFYNALQQLDVRLFSHELAYFCGLAVVFIVLSVYQTYLSQMLQIRWRRWLTDHYLVEWLGDHAYFHLEIGGQPVDNPDQRIANDLQLFVEGTLTLGLGLLSSVVTLASFAAILWTLSGSLDLPLGVAHVVIPGYMLWAALLYALAGTWLTHRIGRPLITLNFDQQRFEADFRFALVRLRENAEPGALYRGEQAENASLRSRFGAIVANWWAIMKRQKRLTWFTSGYNQAAVVFPVLAAAPRYFSGAMQLGGRADADRAGVWPGSGRAELVCRRVCGVGAVQGDDRPADRISCGHRRCEDSCCCPGHHARIARGQFRRAAPRQRRITRRRTSVYGPLLVCKHSVLWR
jgi:vitamin B12/bleomycin/antimicrobial peptide transport system ATP-binding/permease protein